MDVARAPDPRVVGLRHERDRAAVQVRDLLGPVLVDGVVVRHRDRVGVAEVDFLLARPGLALGGLHLDSGALHGVSHLAEQRLVVGGGEDVVVEDVGNRRRQVAVVLRVRLLVGLAEEVELELGAEHGSEAELGGPLHLALEDLSRRGRYRLAVVPTHVAEDERGRLEPRDPAQRGEVRPQDEVAVALLPAGDAVARDGVHLHVVGEQVVAALDAVLVDVVLDEELPVEALAHEPALHVGEGDDHRVDRAVLDRRRQFVQRQHGSGVYAVPHGLTGTSYAA